MTISRNVYNQLFEQTPDAASGGSKEKVIRLRPTEAKAGAVVMSAKSKIQMWTKEEHERFLAALEKFPAGPWKKVADFIGTKTPRQTMTHAQKYRQKIHRRQRGLRNQKKNSVNAESSPTPVDTKADPNGEPNTIVSPYGVADLQLKPGSEAAVAAAAGATNDQLLNILAQQATTINKPEPMEVDSAVRVDTTVAGDASEAASGQGSPTNSNLPSLAEILHLGADGQPVTTQEEQKEGEVAKESVKTEGEHVLETKKMEEQKEMEVKPTQMRPADCKCNCNCSAHGGMKTEEQKPKTEPRPDESEGA
ncbi:Myb-like DNA-binding protein [Phytophthora megakarya]|uniref:Myb-like DNA-binding protein n=1 Tax=Phytophthora megakarya TaxID=4795 RepID=A0A225VC23_9STRA|nr:Myb-like DNA-binding protein [Phytophthora megakarya]